jgi:hypothetical protein
MSVFNVKTSWFWLSVLAIAMAFLESAVVVYLRELYYPDGFSFPPVILPSRIALTEVFREAATVIMLVAAGYLAGKNSKQRFAWFIYSFAVWDIFYYVFLKLILNWPASWFTWDLLFLIPVVWAGPVVTPILVSLTMILLAFAVLYNDTMNGPGVFRWPVFIWIVSGSVLIFLSFIWDYCTYLIHFQNIREIFQPDHSSRMLGLYIPKNFNWLLFLAGEAAEITGIFLIFKTSRSHTRQ